MTVSEEKQSLTARLRSETQALHQRIESRVGLPASIEIHRETLVRFFGFLEPWETLVTPRVADLRSSLGDRRKAALLKTDLQNLGLSESAIAAVPRCTALPDLQDLPGALGSMYVFEGATLGGQILSRHIEKNLGLANGMGYSFYQSYGDRVGQMWRTFTSVLQNSVAAEDHNAAITSASKTFEKLCEWFERASSTPGS